MKSFKEFMLGEIKAQHPMLDGVVIYFGTEDCARKAADMLKDKGITGILNKDFKSKKIEFVDKNTAKRAYEMLPKNSMMGEQTGDENKAPEKFVIVIKAPDEDEWVSNEYTDFNDAYDDFPEEVSRIVKKCKLAGPQELEYRYIKGMG